MIDIADVKTQDEWMAEVEPVLYDDRQAGVDLLPAERFELPELRVRPPYVPEPISAGYFRLLVLKHCAGLNPEVRLDPAELRRRIMRLDIPDCPGMMQTLLWLWPGIWTYQLPLLHSLGGLTIEELAFLFRRVMEFVGKPAQGSLAAWLNRWPDDPCLPMPGAYGWLTSCDVSILPPDAFRMVQGAAGRTDEAESGMTTLRLPGVNFWVETDELNAAQKRLAAQLEAA